MAKRSVTSHKRKIKPSLLERAKRIARMVEVLAKENITSNARELDVELAYTAQDALNRLAYPGIPNIGNAPKGV